MGPLMGTPSMSMDAHSPTNGTLNMSVDIHSPINDRPWVSMDPLMVAQTCP